jgi:hypothetical protein
MASSVIQFVDNAIQCDSICIYLLPLHVSISWPSSEGLIVVVVVVPKHVDFKPSENGQLTETCKGSKYIQIESHWMVIIL